MSGEDLDQYCAENEQRFLDELIDALKIPSISADPEHAADVRRNAEHFADLARAVGFQHVELIETAGHPAVYAELLTDPKLPTVLVYGHHDVQPTDPLDEWISPPFEPTIRDGKLYARGAVDDKGQVFMHLKAVEAHMATRTRLPINLKLILEGEEEIGSVHFEEIVHSEGERFRCDAAVVSDTAFFSGDAPSLCIGLRGMVIAEVILRGPSLDLHSGVFGGTVKNPAEAIAQLVSALKDPVTQRVLVPGFYDAVRDLTEQERAEMAALPQTDETWRHEAGDVPALVGEEGFTNIERRWVRPTLEVNGIFGGYSGPGNKTIIPASAGVKLTCRLVPDQDPEDIAAKLEQALRGAVPGGVRAEIMVQAGGKPVLSSPDHPAIQAASRAVERVFGKVPIYTREGGSIPPAETFARVLEVPVVMIGVGLPDDQIHAPNEKFDLDHYQKGIRTIAHLWDEMASLKTVAAQ